MATGTKEDQNSRTTETREEWSLEKELAKNEQLRKEDVDALRTFCSSLPEVKNLTDNLIVALLHSSEYDLEKARNTANTYFKIRFSLPEIFADRDLDTEAMQTALEVGCYCPLPKRTPEGYRFIFHSLRNKDVLFYDFIAINKIQTLTMDACIYEDPTCPGYIFVGDMTGLSMSHMWKTNFSVTKKLMKFSQEGLAVKIHQLHLLNSSSFTYYLMRWLKPLLSKHLYDLFQIYTADQMEEFLKAVPKEHLPQDYGGDLPKLDTLIDEQVEWLRTMQPKIEFSNNNV